MTAPGGHGLLTLFNWIKDPDKAKRDAAISQIQGNPAILAQLASTVGNDPSALQAILGRDARFGANSQASSSISNAIQNQPIAKAMAANTLNTTDVNSPDYAAKQQQALRGQTPEQQFDSVKQAYSGMRAGTSEAPDYTNQAQKDILAKQQGLQTGYEEQTRNLQNNEIAATTFSALNSAKESAARATLLGQEATKGAAHMAGEAQYKQTAEDFFKAYPSFRGDLTSLFDPKNDKLVPPAVREAVILSDKYGEPAKQQFATKLEQQRLALEKQRVTNEKEYQDRWLPQMLRANAMEAMVKYGGGSVNGFMDLFGGKQTPDASNAANVLAGSTPANKRALAADLDTRAQMILKSGLKGDEAKAAIAAYEPLASMGRAMGINAPSLSYGGQQSGFGGIVSKMTGGAFPKSFHISYDEANDPNLLAQKSKRYDEIKAQNPGMPDAAIQSRVESEFKAKK